MSHLRQELDRYLTIRRSLGYDLGTAERMLKRLSPSPRRKAPSMYLPTCSCDGRWRSGTPIAKPGRRALAW